MKLTFTGLFFLAICLAGCDRQPDFSINKEDTNSLYANNPSFKNVNHRAYTYYFKGAPTAYYGISMQGKDIISGYLAFIGPTPPLCFSRLNFKGRKTFNHLVNDLKTKKFLTKNARPNESFGNISYYTNFSASHNENLYINYNTDFGFGYLTMQSAGCMKAMF